ncbi:MAG: phytase [Syntrophotaleaceae bacterium]
MSRLLKFRLVLSCLLFLPSAAVAAGQEGVSLTGVRYLHPVVVTEMTRYDTDDPAIWINREQPSESLVLGTDKNEDGALYVYDLQGRILQERVVRNLQRPNNVDVEYGFSLAGRSIDIAVVTERLTSKIRIFSLPDMQPLDGGGIEVFAGEEAGDFRAPMGIALYRHHADGEIFAIVGRKSGPSGEYLWQYHLVDNGNGQIDGILVRKLGDFSGRGEIEAIAVDDALGYIYYADEGAGIRKYHADHNQGSAELALFGTDGFTEDREGIAIYQLDETRGYILVSDQQGNRFNIYPREGEPTRPHHHPLLKSVATVTNECDGCEVVSHPLGSRFPHGLFVAMSDNRTFQYYRWEDLAKGEPALSIKGGNVP